MIVVVAAGAKPTSPRRTHEAPSGAEHGSRLGDPGGDALRGRERSTEHRAEARVRRLAPAAAATDRADAGGPGIFLPTGDLCLGMSISAIGGDAAAGMVTGRRRVKTPTAEVLTKPGVGSFRLETAEVAAIDVLCYRPHGFGSRSPVLFVMHGTKRNAADYRDAWVPTADRYGCLLLCPRFPRRTYPGRAYHRGGVLDRAGAVRPASAWTFGLIERIFDVVRDATGNTSRGYHLYGHSAGGQFVHRLALLLPETRFVAAMAANAGWYTMPTFGERFPYGLAGSGVTAEAVGAALGRPLTVLVGERDVAPDDPYLRTEPPALAQGANRLERARAFLAAARAEAARRGTGCAWRLETVPGAAHLDAEMMPAAARLLFEAG